MKKRKIFAVVMAAVMTLSMVACGEKQTNNDVTPTTAPTATTAPTEAPEATATPAPTEVPVQEASIDFEDGNYGFAMIKTKPRRADESVLSLASYNGSNALYVENAGGAEMYVGFDIDAILGDKVTEVRSISMTLGTEHSDGKFASTAGYLLAYTGEALTETKLEGWSVYMEKKNPKTVTFTLPEDVAFTAGNDNYICLSKMEDNGKVISSMYIDDIRFFDANGNVIKGDTTVVMEAPNGFVKVVEEEEPASASDVKVTLDEAYMGDWALTTAIPADAFATFTNGVKVTFKYELASGYDYYLWKPLDAAWGAIADCGLTAKAAAEEGDKYHLQADGFIVIDDWTNNELTITLSAEAVAAVVAAGGLAGQTYGVTTFQAVLSDPFAGMVSEKVALDEAYMGDWAATTVIPADVLSKFAGNDVTVTLKYELQSGYDYYLLAPMDAGWGLLKEKTGLAPKAAAEEGDKYHLQADGFVVIDDWTNNELVLNIKAADLDAIIAAGGLMGQTYGVTTYEAVITGAAATTMKEKVALDEKYMGDWAATTVLPADVLAKFPGDVTVTLKFELQSGYDYYLLAPMDAGWSLLKEKTGLAPKAAAEEGDKYHLQADGFVVIDDLTNNELVINITAADLAAIVAAGGLMGQTYGVTVYEAVIEGEIPSVEVIKEKATLDEKYMGDWAATTVLPADVLAKFPGDVTVTLKFELQSGYDYYLLAPMDAGWGLLKEKTGLAPKAAAEEGDKYHLQADGFIVIDDLTNNELVLNITAADLAAIVAAGGLMGQTYGVTVYEAVIEGAVPVVETVKEKVAADENYAGDWAQAGIVSADVLSKFSGMDVTVTLKYELQSGYDYYLLAPMDCAWGLFKEKTGLTPKAAAEEGDTHHLQSDGFIVFDDLTAAKLTYTLSAADLEAAIAAGGLCGQTYGVTVYEVVLEGTPAASAPAVDTPAVEEPVEEPVDTTGTLVYSGSVAITGANWWAEAEVSLDAFLGTTDPATVKFIKFTSTIDFTIGYNGTAGWTQPTGKDSYIINDMDFANYYMKCCISRDDGAEYTINWEVYTEAAE